MKKMGKIMYEVICPICNTGYLAEGRELVGWKRVEFDGVEERWVKSLPEHADRAAFYCEDCNRQVWTDVEDMEIVKVGKNHC